MPSCGKPCAECAYMYKCTVGINYLSMYMLLVQELIYTRTLNKSKTISIY